MEKILVPTDFSGNANNALEYAVALAEKEHAKLVLLHAIPITYTAPDLGGSVLTDKLASVEKESRRLLGQMCEEVKRKQVTCEYICETGLPVEVITNALRGERPQLVVMGTRGASGIGEFLIGSNTAKVIGNSECPVIAVPEKAVYNGIKKITYATDYHKSDLTALKEVVKIARLFRAQLNVLHIADGEFTAETEKETLRDFMSKVNDELDYNNVSYQLIQGNDVEKKLQEYVNEKYSDLLAMSTRHRGLIDKLFGKSITIQMAYHTRVPLLVFHYKQEPVVFI